MHGHAHHVPHSISSCRRRKRKCDGARPICGACARLSLPCAYPASGKKRGPQAGVVKRLRQEVKTLESQVKVRAGAMSCVSCVVLCGMSVVCGRCVVRMMCVICHSVHMCHIPQIEHTSTSKSARLSTPASAMRISTILDSHEFRTRNDTYLKSYFELLNATMFPFLEQTSFMEERVKYQQQEVRQGTTWQCAADENGCSVAPTHVASTPYRDFIR